MRNLDPATAAALSAQNVGWATLAMLTFKSSTQYVWSGPGPLQALGHTFTGVGSLGAMGALDEGSDGKAEGTTLTLSGIDPVWLASAMTDVQLGAPAMVWWALLTPQITIIGQPAVWFAGVIDKPPVAVGAEEISIMLTLENQLVNHERPNGLKYTTEDQRLSFPDDTGFAQVERLNDLALRWGS